MNQMPPTQSQNHIAIQQQQQQPQKQMQHQNSLPPSSSTVGSWYQGVSAAGHHGHQQQPHHQQGMVLSRTYPSNATGLPDGYAMQLANGGRSMMPYYEGSMTMQKVSPNHMASDPIYNNRGQAMMQGHFTQKSSGFMSNAMMQQQQANGPNDLMLDPSSVAMPTHQMMSSSSVDRCRQMQVMSPNADFYQDERMAAASACRPMYLQQQQQQFDPCLASQGPTTDSIRMQTGALETSPDATGVCRGSLAPQQQRMMMMGYPSNPSSAQRVMPYPNPQQYMQNKRAQYNGRRKMYDYDPTMQNYSNGCYGNGWPRQSLPQRPMTSPDGYPGGLPCHIKEEPADASYLMQMGTGPIQNQCQPTTMWQSNREPVQLRNNNAFSPPPGNPTPPMTPGSTSMPYNALDASSDVPPDIGGGGGGGSRMFRESELYFTFPVHDGMIKVPFQLEHNAPVSCHIFNINDQLHESLMARPDLDLMLKCFHKEDRLLATNWPASVSISLNEVPLMIDRGATPACPHQPIFLKSICRPGQNALQISVTTCCCSHLFVLQIVHRPSVRSLFQGLITKRLLPASNTIGKIKRLLSQVTMTSPVLTNEQQSLPLPLTCPLSMQRIVVPSRGRECQHIQCFDLESYLKLNCQRNHWHCPLCKKGATLDGLEVDQFIWAVLDHPSSVCSDAVLLDISANWKPLRRPGAEYGSEANVYKKFVMASAMPLPSPGGAYLTGGKGGPMPNGMPAAAAAGSSISQQTEMPDRQHRPEAPNHLGCLSQMTSVFLGPDASPSVAPQTNNMEHMSFPPTPMGSQISQICTPLDGQSLHPRTPSEGHATHPHTPPDGHPFTPLDSQSQPYGKMMPETHGTVGISPQTPFDPCSSGKRGTSATTSADGGHCPPVTMHLDANSEGRTSESGKQDRTDVGKGGDSVETMENRLMTEDLTNLDFKSNLSHLCNDDDDDTDNQDNMISLLPDSFDYDLTDLTCYLGESGTKSPANKSTMSKDPDDDFLSCFN